MKDTGQNLARRVLTDPVHIMAFGFGTGLAPFAPGTVGSLLGVLLAWLTLDLGLITQIGALYFCSCQESGFAAKVRVVWVFMTTEASSGTR